MTQPRIIAMICTSSRTAIAHGRYRGSGASVQRTAHMQSAAHWEGPYEVMAAAWRMLGSEADAQLAGKTAALAAAARVA